MRKRGTDGKCHYCSEAIVRGVAYVSFGATIDLLELERVGLADNEMEAFCSVGYHGTRSDVADSADYCVADAVPGGQLDLSFCSLRCLRLWGCGVFEYLKQEMRHYLPESEL